MSRAQGETVQNRLRRKRGAKGREGTPVPGEGRVTGCLLCRSAGRRVIRTGTKVVTSGLPWWSSDEQSTCQRRGQGFNPLSEKILHASGQLSLSTRTAERSSRATNLSCWSPCTLEPLLCSKRNHCDEKLADHTRKEPSRSATGESPRAAARTQSRQKYVIFLNFHLIFSNRL